MATTVRAQPAKVDHSKRHSGGRANFQTALLQCRDHYKRGWTFKEYFVERVKRGFLVENWSATYTKHTLNQVDLAYNMAVILPSNKSSMTSIPSTGPIGHKSESSNHGEQGATAGRVTPLELHKSAYRWPG